MQSLTTTQKLHLYHGGHVGVTITGETLDGDPIALTEDDIIEGSFSIDRNWTSGSTIEIGCAETSELIFELDNADGRWSNLRWEGARLTVVLDIAGEPLQVGVFTVDERPGKLTTIQLKALDDMARFNRPYLPGIPYPATLRQILIDCCAQCSVTLYTVEFDNGDYVVSEQPEGDDITFHHVVAWVAELAGCNAWIDEYARLQLSWYGDNQQQPADSLEITPDHRYSYELAETDIQITGIAFRTTIPGEDGADDQEVDYLAGTDDYALVIEENPLLQENFESVLSAIYQKIGGFHYRPYSFEILGYPHLWPGDRITKLIDAEGEEHASIITNHTYKLNGKSSIEARGETETVRGYATGAPFTPRQKRILRSVANIEAARQTSNLEQAVLRLNELMVNSLGYYATVVEQPSGARITYTHDKPLLEESAIIWTMTEQGLAWTDQGWNDGAPVWQYGVTADGSIIAKLLDVIGIRAEWIEVGTAGDYIEGEIGDARDYARDLLNSLADGTYTGGTFIDGTTLYSPNIIGLNILGMTGEFDSLRAGAALGAHVEIGAQDSLPFISMHDDDGNVITGITKQGIMIDPRGKINLPYLVSSNPDNAVIRTVNTVDRRYLMLRSGEGEENGAMIYIYNENDPTYPGQLRLYSGGSITAVLRTDNSVWFRGGVEVDGLISTSAFRTNAAGNLMVEGKFFTYGEAVFDDEIRMRGNQPIRFPYYGHDITPAGVLRVPRTSGRRYMIWDSHDGGAGARILLYSDSDSNTPGQIRLYPGAGSDVGLLIDADRSARFYGDLRYDGGLYRGSTRGIPAADIQSGAVTTAKIASGAVTTAKIAAGAVTSAKTSGYTGTVAAGNRNFTFTNGLCTATQIF